MDKAEELVKAKQKGEPGKHRLTEAVAELLHPTEAQKMQREEKLRKAEKRITEAPQLPAARRRESTHCADWDLEAHFVDGVTPKNRTMVKLLRKRIEEIMRGEVSKEAYEAFCTSMKLYRFKEDEIVCHEKEIGRTFFIVNDGKFETSIDGSVTGMLQPGEYFCVDALFGPVTLPSTVKAVSKSASLFGASQDVFRLSLGETWDKTYEEICNLMEPVPFFDDLTVYQKHHLSRKLMLEKFKVGTKVVTEGEPGESLFIVKDGELSVYLGATFNEEGELTGGKKIKELKVGDYFGESSFLCAGEVCQATVVADITSELLSVTPAMIMEILAS